MSKHSRKSRDGNKLLRNRAKQRRCDMVSRQSRITLKVFGALTVVFFLLTWIDEQFDETFTYVGRRSRQDCRRPVRDVLFLKTHKTGSSTVTSVLNVYADINDLDIAIPTGENTRFNWPYEFRHESVDARRLKTSKANVFCNHAVLNKPEMSLVMSQPFKSITILREPVEQFISFFYYEKLDSMYNLSNERNPVLTFINCPECYIKRPRSMVVAENLMLLRNGMSFDLGYDSFKRELIEKANTQDGDENERVRNETSIYREFISHIDNEFDLVLITEFFDEGMVMLQELLCWKLMDVIYDKKLVNQLRPRVASEASAKIAAWNDLDSQLYQYFRNKLITKMEEFGQSRLERKVEQLRTLNALVRDFCRNSTDAALTDVTSYLRRIREEPVKFFLTNPACYCIKRERSEISYQAYFKIKFPTQYFGSLRMRSHALKDLDPPKGNVC